ncbi:MAG: HAD family hydrolase [Christensenellales bacterium]|jgi:phosphoglycolate phosphatase
MRYSHILWDWNGTLLDDVRGCLSCVNRMLAARKMAALASVEAYRKVFGFPVMDYYRLLGFDFEKEPYEDLAREYMDLYLSEDYALYPGAARVLAAARKRGVRQVILSASETSILQRQIEKAGIAPYIDGILGTDNILAAGKAETGRAFMESGDVSSALLVGDTLHDHEVARFIGADCLLVANGHQCRETLLSSGAPVLENIAGVLDFIESAYRWPGAAPART